MIASCGYDNSIRIWKESNGQWQKVAENQLSSSVSCVAWAPWEYGLILAAGTAEGKLFMVEHQKDGWKEPVLFGQHHEAVNGISWGPSTEPALLSVKPA